MGGYFRVKADFDFDKAADSLEEAEEIAKEAILNEEISRHTIVKIVYVSERTLLAKYAEDFLKHENTEARPVSDKEKSGRNALD